MTEQYRRMWRKTPINSTQQKQRKKMLQSMQLIVLLVKIILGHMGRRFPKFA